MPKLLDKLFAKNQSGSFIKAAQPVVAFANTLSDEFEKLSDADLKARLAQVKERTKGKPESDKDIAEVFALVREASRRTLKERHYDVQLIGGLVLGKGKIAEMRTGEGKTLVATLPVTLYALSGKGVHVVTVNDYLARRDAAWMGQVYDCLGLSVGVVTSGGAYIYDATHVPSSEDETRDEEGSFKVFYDYLRPATKQEAYAADVTYATNNELGFDYLRDNTAYDASQIVQRGHHYAVVDEIDSILIDEARTPLIISGPAAEAAGLYERFSGIVHSFVRDEDYVVDEKQRAVQITEQGIQKAEKALGIDNLYSEGGMKYAHHLDTAVRAKALFSKDKEYVVKDGEVVIVDEFTGRLQPGRRWSEGLHQAMEAKEGTPIQKETRTYASVTFQNYFRMYEAVAGMTGTGVSSEEEFFTVYGLEVVRIPTHRPIARKDYDDLIFQTAQGKYKALAAHIKNIHETGQPVLIGTVSIEDNEVVSSYLTKAGVPHEVLNAKNHEREGEIIAQAGRKGGVTVATNLAGRGVDIKLGGAVTTQEEREEIRSVGGLAVIGTERHEARRIDDQLRGRSGRQGDPGETRFYVSLEDKLMRVFASDMVKKVMGSFKIPEDEPIQSSLITRALETAQKRIEGFNFDSRKQVLAYDDVLNSQRLSIYKERRTALLGTNEEIEALIYSMVAGNKEAETAFASKKEEFGDEVFAVLMRRLLLQVTDAFWLEHLETMDYLRRSVSLRAYGQRDPLIEYRKEGLARFKHMQASVQASVAEAISRIRPADDARIRAEEEKTRAKLVAASEGGEAPLEQKPIVHTHTYGRNDEVTIQKGEETQTLKYKKAEALLNEGWEIVTKS
ncbi:preprotein translocase subunit SecA [Patescibacteria group bacterium]|nr:preprotein translocase subunit SecA [Patescibacteria group bacterium]MBU2081014.1 preprotein translocase subunit SecA [Patescibacteria group bacterium]MBU2124105.1 preprotein translocase subunit SecA [Patescibacteria group bacterium]MBU2194961.1 preprotein translocase subunit SecA [Patescibacteria group bacterium]